ncbi:MATE family efflux transporter [Persicimonas caeni]|uniref:MATE family efflux transporter n=1 Tax=Persicimonas caeni TaxID=2292766 RepID=A0A4Y6PXR7_PERCE|nr:MATE family efflux transporter [Persicimonas caeni]QDG52535.1 MATE family efflux transporter [Persicimonas caeni]QED33757.1 MATE family efflux transporter [Persicimonas caeni]
MTQAAKKRADRDLTKGSLPKHIVRLAGPMALGILAIMTMNIVDTYFVGQLGTDQLAAMSFTFPVVFFLSSLTLGMGVGVTSVVSRAVGRKDHPKARRVTTDALALATIVVAVISVAGYLTIEPIFTMLGAAPKLMPLITEYMSIWYFGAAFLVVPMIGNAAIRSTGDTRTPALIMLGVAGLNMLLDPLFIFGVGDWEGWGIGGAATASVVSRGVALVAAFWILRRREDLISFEMPDMTEVLQSWREVMRVGAPAGATRSVVPLTNAFITALIAGFGTEAVAGYGAATRVEAFALVLSNGLTASLGPLVGQNWGAHQKDRVYKAIIYTCTAVAAVSVAIWGLLYGFAEPIGDLFTDSDEAIAVFVLFVAIVPLGHALQGTFRAMSNAWNAIDRPFPAAALSLLRTVGLIAPFAWLGAEFFGISGMFWGIMLANATAGLVAIVAAKPVIESTDHE